jgi:hypothetical protein
LPGLLPEDEGDPPPAPTIIVLVALGLTEIVELE